MKLETLADTAASVQFAKFCSAPAVGGADGQAESPC